ncbi:MAG: type secretion system FliP/YscR family protein [Hyphomicrobiales bacterium]|nr:type secretion system FliP/YscR family protein [Hyphomicrobiales bacterium]
MLALTAALSLLPIFAVVATSFAKISIVLLIVRNAIGVQQTPPNQLVYGIALLLTYLVMEPVFYSVFNTLSSEAHKINQASDLPPILLRASQPIRAFMDRFSLPENRQAVADALQTVRAGTGGTAPSTSDFGVLTAAFLISELTRAFELGFILYLPFLVVDFVVSAILVALGMQMMSPTVISTPLKLLVFVTAHGWSRLLEGLLLSYGVKT